MKARLWWISSGIFLLLCVGFVYAAYRFDWSTTGFPDKTLWDWLQLLIVPLVLAIGALAFQLANTRTESQIAQQRYEQDQRIAMDKQHEDLLQAYLDRIAELLLEKQLAASDSEEVRQIARVRTITVLTQLDAQRIGYIFTFLREVGLMSTASTNCVVSLKDADLHTVEWGKANLVRANLSGANLSGANLINADLNDANLIGANLSGANLSGANLINADLSGANLVSANLTKAILSSANLSGANLVNADLSGAVLINNADLSGADLINANLSGANLSGADLSKTDLSGAILSDAKVTEERLKEVESLEGTMMPDGSTYAP